MTALERHATQLSSRRSHTPPDENTTFLPTPAASSQEGTSKPKQLPTITPRRFKRFFTPRSSLKRNVKIGKSRQVLRDITSGGSNRRSARQGPLSEEAIQIFEDQDENFVQTSKKRKRGFPISPDTTPANSSPLKRFRGHTPVDQEVRQSDVESDYESVISESNQIQEADWQDEPEAVRPIVRWKQKSLLGSQLRRECSIEGCGTPRRNYKICGPGKPKFKSGICCIFVGLDNEDFYYLRIKFFFLTWCSKIDLMLTEVLEWQHETVNFFTRPEDRHACANVAPTESKYAIPFCTASCNSTSPTKPDSL